MTKEKKDVQIESTSEDDDDFSIQSSGESDFSFFNSDEELDKHLTITRRTSRTASLGKRPEEEEISNKGNPTEEPPLKETLKEGNFVIILWNEKEFPGVVLSTSSDGAIVDCMGPTKNAWKWPTVKDTSFYIWSDIKMKIDTPKLIKRSLFPLPSL